MNTTPSDALPSRGAPAPGSPRAVTTGATKPIPPGDWSNRFVFVGSVALDWLTLTTRDPGAFAAAVRLLQGHTPADGRQAAQVMQYIGFKGDGYFFGAGEQQGEAHFMVRLSGSVAQSFMLAAANYPRILEAFKCTRADVQYTYNEVPPVRLEEFGKALEAAEWTAHKGRKPKIEWWHNAEGLDTLYIGSRSSVRLQRIYVKSIDGLPQLRWEVEYKEQLAQNLWLTVLKGGLAVLPGILAGEMAVIPLAVCPELANVAQAVGDSPARLKLARDDGEPIKAVEWLWNAVLPCVRRLQSDNPYIRRLVRDFVLSALLGPDCDLPPPVDDRSLDGFLREWEVGN